MKRRLALVLGRQGSGKTTRVCAQVARHYEISIKTNWFRKKAPGVRVIPNFYNHVTLSDNNDVFFISGTAHGKASHSLEMVLTAECTILELPHSGWLPKGINGKFNTQGLETKAFVLMIPEGDWRGYAGDVGVILTPELWMSTGPQIVAREYIDYQSDCARIRKDIEQSDIPASYFSNAEEMIQAICRYIV